MESMKLAPLLEKHEPYINNLRRYVEVFAGWKEVSSSMQEVVDEYDKLVEQIKSSDIYRENLVSMVTEIIEKMILKINLS